MNRIISHMEIVLNLSNMSSPLFEHGSKAGSVRLTDIPLTKMGQIMGNNLVVYYPDKFISSSIQTPSVKKSVDEKKVVKGKSVIADDKGMLRFVDIFLV